MKELFKKREEFNKAFEIGSRTDFGLISTQQANLEYKMLLEELDEYIQAVKDKDKTEVLDAITDMLYLIIGCAHKHGLKPEQLEQAYNEVHRSNMCKLWNGKVIKNNIGKVMKPITFSPPNFYKIIK